jgi:hypothetical protein
VDDCDEGVTDIGGIRPMDENLPPTNDGGACIEFNCFFGYNICSFASHHVRNHKGTEGVTLSNHANSLFYNFCIKHLKHSPHKGK